MFRGLGLRVESLGFRGLEFRVTAPKSLEFIVRIV